MRTWTELKKRQKDLSRAKHTTLAIPKIGCGLGQIRVVQSRDLVNKIFGESTIRVKVYSRPNEDVVVDSDRTDGT